MSDKAEKSKPPMETIEPSIGPNTTGLADQARAAQWRKEDAGDEPAPAETPAPRRPRKRARKSGGAE